MGWWRSIVRRLGGSVDRDLDRELRAHLESEADDQSSAGLTPRAAREAARRAFGNVICIAEDTRAVWGWTRLESCLLDIRYAWRGLRKSPGFAIVALLSLALGIGANTAIFTFVNAALLKPLPYPDSGRIVALHEMSPGSREPVRVHPNSFVPWRERAQSFEALALAQTVPANTEGADGAEQVTSLWTTPAMFRVFGVAAFIGRVFDESEGLPPAAGRAGEGGAPVILSHGYWQRRFASDPTIVGQSIRIGRNTSVVIGVMPPGFQVASLRADLYTPLRIDPNRPGAVGSRSFQCFGRLRPGVTVAAARAEMEVLAAQIAAESKAAKPWGATVLSLRESLVQASRWILLLLLGVVGLVLAIACANVAGLMLTRGIGRAGEMALRASLGAGRGRLAQQLLIESVTLSVFGGALGLVLGVWASRALAAIGADAMSFGQLAEAGLDLRVLLFNAGVSLATGILFGLTPSWQASRLDLRDALSSSRGAGVGRGQRRLRDVLVVAEVALAVVLLVGAGLLLRTFTGLLRVRLGFEPRQAVTMRLFITGDAAHRSQLVESLLDRIEPVPQVRAAGTIQFLPLSGHTNNGPFHVVGRPLPPDPAGMESDVSTVSRGYFAAMGIPVLRGRPFERRDTIDGTRVAVVNQTFVRRFFPDEDPIGLRIIGDWANPKPTEIIGVVGDIRHNGLTTEPRPTVFLAQAQVPGYITYVVVRSAAPPPQVVRAVRAAIREVDPTQALTDIQGMDRYVEAALTRPRLYALFLGGFALLALLLAGIGLYGLLAYTVRSRTPEIGIRIALGARPADVLRQTLLEGVRLALAGLTIGLGCAAALSRLVSKLLYGVTAGDPSTYAAVAIVLGLVSVLAAYIPARRAAHVDAMVALRHS